MNSRFKTMRSSQNQVFYVVDKATKTSLPKVTSSTDYSDLGIVQMEYERR